MISQLHILHCYEPPQHDKVYIAVVKDGMVHKFWGRRGKRLNYSTDTDTVGIYKLIRNKVSEGYKDRLGDTKFRQDRALEISNMGMSDIAKIVDDNIVESLPVQKEEESWTNKAIVCKNNKGYEKHFEKGVEYLCLEDCDNNSLDILVLDMENEKILIPRKKFKGM